MKQTNFHILNEQRRIFEKFTDVIDCIVCNLSKDVYSSTKLYFCSVRSLPISFVKINVIENGTSLHTFYMLCAISLNSLTAVSSPALHRVQMGVQHVRVA